MRGFSEEEWDTFLKIHYGKQKARKRRPEEYSDAEWRDVVARASGNNGKGTRQ